jgi:pseudouridine-5'-phosphate glycosidase
MAPEVDAAVRTGAAVVALETAVLTHGLPRIPSAAMPWVEAFEAWLRDSSTGLGIEHRWRRDEPLHLEAVRAMAAAVRARGATPAVVGVVEGELWVGLDAERLEHLAQATAPAKLSGRDLAPAMAQRRSGGTTVAGTLAAVRAVRHGSISTMATGGIGGAHRGWARTADVSADLDALATSMACVVCSGPKAILDLDATVEMLDTGGVATIGYRTAHWPRFVLPPDRRLPLEWQVETAEEAAEILRCQRALGTSRAGVLLLQAVPEPWAIEDAGGFEALLDRAASDGAASGPSVTPHLLGRLAADHDAMLPANLALLVANAALAAEVSVRGEDRSCAPTLAGGNGFESPWSSAPPRTDH